MVGGCLPFIMRLTVSEFIPISFASSLYDMPRHLKACCKHAT